MKIIVGLGNPGEKYAKVRHNLGFMVLGELAKRIKSKESSFKKENKLKSEILQLSLIHNSNCLILAKPQTYMNNSGLAVRQLADYFKVDSTDIIIVHDDLDLMLGQIKVRTGGAAAGHHGVESIISAIGNNFTRVRVGIGRGKYPEKFVLEPFLPSEKSKLKHAIKQATIVILNLIQDL